MKEKLTKVLAAAPFLKCPPIIFGLCLFFFLLWLEHSKDPYERTFDEITVHGTNVAVISVTPREIKAPYPTVIYLHGSRGNAIGNGRDLRQFADAGFAAVTMEYSQGSQQEFNQEMPALLSWVQQQGWADTNHPVWVGFSLGSQRMLEYYLTQPGNAPQILVRVAGGLVDGVGESTAADQVIPKHVGHPKVLLFHGQQDRVFPLADVGKVADWFRARGSSVTSWILPNSDHAFGSDREWVMRCVTDEVAKAMGLSRSAYRPFGMLHTAKVALAAILVFLACWLGPKLLRPQEGESRTFRRIALGAFALAVLVTAYHLILPRVLPAGKYAAWFQHDLDTDAEREGFRWLSSLPDYQGRTCYEIMDQVRPACFRKSFLYHELDAEIFREFVLIPKLSSEENAEMQWRWPFWLELYPKIRKCTNAEEAVEIIIRATRERLGVPNENAPETDILTMWWTGQAKPGAYQKILVAALRSVGVASRLDASGRAEFWTGKEWKHVVDKLNPFEVSARERQ